MRQVDLAELIDDGIFAGQHIGYPVRTAERTAQEEQAETRRSIQFLPGGGMVDDEVAGYHAAHRVADDPDRLFVFQDVNNAGIQFGCRFGQWLAPVERKGDHIMPGVAKMIGQFPVRCFDQRHRLDIGFGDIQLGEFAGEKADVVDPYFFAVGFEVRTHDTGQ